jgi:tetratricopeptide (TPR) repeat protein
VRALCSWKAETVQLIAAQALFTVKQQSLLPPDYSRRWFRLASTQNRLPGDNFYANWFAYDGEADAERAGQFLERCLAEAGRMNDDQKNRMIAEAIVFLAYRRGDLAKAEAWPKHLTSPDRLDAMAQIRTSVALSCARARFDDALRHLERGLALIRQQPVSKTRMLWETSWTSWYDEILRRQSAATTPS